MHLIRVAERLRASSRLCVVCGVWCVVCGVWCVVCGVVVWWLGGVLWAVSCEL